MPPIHAEGDAPLNWKGNLVAVLDMVPVRRQDLQAELPALELAGQ